jgi:hypothetical protein
MKRTILAVAVIALAGTAFGQSRVVDTIRVYEGSPVATDIAAITITSPSLLKSISSGISASGETNSFTITYVSKGGITSTLATAVTDDIAGSESVNYYNYDADSATGDTVWLQKGDVLSLTGNDGTQTDYSNVIYRVVFEVDLDR